MTGSQSGTNTTDNSVTYKEGAGVTDAKAQNLIKDNSHATAIWTIADLSASGTNVTGTKFFGLWIYVKDATALAKLKSSGTCFEVKLGSAVGDYYSLTKTLADFSTGWNWVTGNTVAVEDLTESGTVAGAIDTFIIEITTNNSTDTFAAGDVVYDLLRTWVASDLIKSFVTSYPTFDTTNKEVTVRCRLASTQANGFPVSEIGLFNIDTVPRMISHDVFTAQSKSSTDEIAFILIDEVD